MRTLFISLFLAIFAYGQTLTSVAVLPSDATGNALSDNELDFDTAWNNVESNRSARNTFYVIGGVVLATGIGVHIWF